MNASPFRLCISVLFITVIGCSDAGQPARMTADQDLAPTLAAASSVQKPISSSTRSAPYIELVQESPTADSSTAIMPTSASDSVPVAAVGASSSFPLTSAIASPNAVTDPAIVTPSQTAGEGVTSKRPGRKVRVPTDAELKWFLDQCNTYPKKTSGQSQSLAEHKQ